MLNKNGDYIIEDYHRKSLFSSFLPGISGEHGIPLWCYYVNRGQGISCFGVEDKNHSIMEFYPAHQAYERTPLLGFRTFLKVDGEYSEAFTDMKQHRSMEIGMNSLSIEEKGEKYKISVVYTTLPQEPVAALMRKVQITNITEEEISIEAADGMAEVIPYGINGSSMKEMGQTSKAWMETLDAEKRMPKFKVRASMEDSAQVTKVQGANFAFARDDDGQLLFPVADRQLLFGADSALIKAWGFEENTIEELETHTQATCNDVPCCFFVASRKLKPMESFTIKEIYGMSQRQEYVERIAELAEGKTWFEDKQREAVKLTELITDRIATKTGNAVFDAYCRQDYLDNLLRGGYPIQLSPEKIFYLYSRKHGDMERDYNFFSMLPEMYSQGNGNFRDVNQNRRCDIFFSPFVGKGSIKTFYNALQMNGYNPLSIEKVTYRLAEEQYEQILLGETHRDMSMTEASRAKLDETVRDAFTPGRIDEILQEGVEKKEEREKLFADIMDAAASEDCTKFGEGYWCDHWTYNLDLIESYLSVYPEQKEALLFLDTGYHYRQAEKSILPRHKRYVKTKDGIRQYHFLKDNVDTDIKENRYLKDTEGNLIRGNLASKLLSLITVKMAALDPYGMGLEMEGGKPGWYDALNGLPGLLGSSMAETYELLRCIQFLREAVASHNHGIEVVKEAGELAEAICHAKEIYCEELLHQDEVIDYWNEVNDAKEHFWEATAKTVSGDILCWERDKVLAVLDDFAKILDWGIEKAKRMGHSVRPTYFYYEAEKWKETEEGIVPLTFQVYNTPDFLEGSVHSLKLAKNQGDKREIYESVLRSRLYDKKLKMYKVNASLGEASFELGRACAFTPGWLENESVWLHMEYKYLLELLKAGMYEEFLTDFHNAGVPFLPEEQYGRSLLENSSFIASSVNPNPDYHGKGFVARLSGSTAEFLEMWKIIMFGASPFSIQNDELKLMFAPCIPDYLIGEERRIEASFLGSTLVRYELDDRESYIPGNYRVAHMEVRFENGLEIFKESITGEKAKAIREGKAREIKVSLVKLKK